MFILYRFYICNFKIEGELFGKNEWGPAECLHRFKTVRYPRWPGKSPVNALNMQDSV